MRIVNVKEQPATKSFSSVVLGYETRGVLTALTYAQRTLVTKAENVTT